MLYKNMKFNLYLAILRISLIENGANKNIYYKKTAHILGFKVNVYRFKVYIAINLNDTYT